MADILYKKGYSLYFYKSEQKNRKIDFLIQKEGQVIPIEVKSHNSRASSLHAFMNEHTEINTAFKFIDGNTGDKDQRIMTMPLYMAMFL